METPNSEFEIKGIQCDNSNCSYVDMSVKFEDYKEWVNKPCPLCGENLLTEDSHEQIVSLMEASAYINTLSPDEIKNLTESATEEEMDSALDLINSLGLKKVGDLEDGREYWSTDKNLKNERADSGNETSDSVE